VRLAAAGCERELFSSDAVAMLHEATLGALRNIDRLAAAASRPTTSTPIPTPTSDPPRGSCHHRPRLPSLNLAMDITQPVRDVINQRERQHWTK